MEDTSAENNSSSQQRLLLFVYRGQTNIPYSNNKLLSDRKVLCSEKAYRVSNIATLLTNRESEANSKDHPDTNSLKRAQWIDFLNVTANNTVHRHDEIVLAYKFQTVKVFPSPLAGFVTIERLEFWEKLAYSSSSFQCKKIRCHFPLKPKESTIWPSCDGWMKWKSLEMGFPLERLEFGCHGERNEIESEILRNFLFPFFSRSDLTFNHCVYATLIVTKWAEKIWGRNGKEWDEEERKGRAGEKTPTSHLPFLFKFLGCLPERIEIETIFVWIFFFFILETISNSDQGMTLLWDLEFDLNLRKEVWLGFDKGELDPRWTFVISYTTLAKNRNRLIRVISNLKPEF